MKKSLLTAIAFLFSVCLFAQKINGQWRGYFDSKGDIGLFSGGNTEYVLEIEINGADVNGSSYTYFEGRKYYVICSLSGSYNKKDGKIVVTETARIKGSTPPDWNDCLQTHVLYYQKEEGKELLVGNWKTAPGQISDCGVGFTTLSRRVIANNNNVSFNKSSRTPVTKSTTVTKIPDLTDKNKKDSEIVKAIPAKPKPQVVPPVVKNSTPEKPKMEPSPVVTAPVKKVTEVKTDDQSLFEKRNSNVIKTIEIDKETFKVDLYDNGDIDGDSISLFFNGKLLLAHQRLGTKAISLTLEIDEKKATNELVMYAENLGEIPPNTALMVVTDGDNRYEVRIASDLEKSGVIRFVHRAKTGQ